MGCASVFDFQNLVDSKDRVNSQILLTARQQNCQREQDRHAEKSEGQADYFGCGIEHFCVQFKACLFLKLQFSPGQPIPDHEIVKDYNLKIVFRA